MDIRPSRAGTNPTFSAITAVILITSDSDLHPLTHFAIIDAEEFVDVDYRAEQSVFQSMKLSEINPTRCGSLKQRWRSR